MNELVKTLQGLRPGLKQKKKKKLKEKANESSKNQHITDNKKSRIEFCIQNNNNFRKLGFLK